MLEKPSSSERFDLNIFFKTLMLLDIELSRTLQHLQTALDETNEEQVVILTTKKIQLINAMFQQLASAYKATDGDISDIPQFETGSEYHMKLSVPYSGYILWAKVIKWFAEREGGENHIKQINDQASQGVKNTV